MKTVNDMIRALMEKHPGMTDEMVTEAIHTVMKLEGQDHLLDIVYRNGTLCRIIRQYDGAAIVPVC